MAACDRPSADTRDMTENESLTRPTIRKLAGGAALAFAFQVSGAGFSYLSQIALARWMTLTDFGTYNYLLAWSNLLALFSGLGFSISALRFVAQYRRLRDDARVRGFFRVSRIATSAAGIVFAAIAAAVIAVAFHLSSTHRTYVILGAVALIPIRAIMNLDSAVIRALGGVVRAYAPSLALRPLALLVLASVAWFVWGRISALEGILITLCVFSLVTLLQSRLLHQLLCRSRWTRVPIWIGSRGRPDQGLPAVLTSRTGLRPLYESRSWLRVSLPLLLVTGFLVILAQADLLIVGSSRGARSAALYSVASNTATLVSYVLVAVSAMTAPLFAELHSARDHAGMQRLAAIAAQWIFWPTVLIVVGLGLLAPYVLATFGSAFGHAQLALTILLIGQLVNAACGSVGWLMSMTGNQVALAKVYGAASLLNVILCYLGAREFGLAGAAAGTTVSMITWNLWLVWLTRRRIGIQTSIVASIAYLGFPHFALKRARGAT